MATTRNSESNQGGDQCPTVIRRIVADDESTKYVWRLADGLSVESITIMVPERAAAWSLATQERRTWPAMRIAGVSSQVGCNVRCRFCATGLQPNKRNLLPHEMTAQVFQVLSDFSPVKQVGVTFAGMGEPLLNTEAVLLASQELLEDDRVDHVTISTSGIVPSIKRLARQATPLGLWISLHASSDQIRDALIPHNRKYPIAAVLAAATEFGEATQSRVGISYLLLPGINDSREDAKALCNLIDNELFNVQILLWNEIPGMHFTRAAEAAAATFQNWLSEHGQDAYIMASGARKIDGGCGQLVTEPSPLRVTQAITLATPDYIATRDHDTK